MKPETHHTIRTDRSGPFWRRRWTATAAVTTDGHRSRDEAIAAVEAVVAGYADAEVRDITTRALHPVGD